MSYCEYVCGVRVKRLALFQLGIQFQPLGAFQKCSKNSRNLQLGIKDIYSAFEHGGCQKPNISFSFCKSLPGMGEGYLCICATFNKSSTQVNQLLVNQHCIAIMFIDVFEYFHTFTCNMGRKKRL